jgi:hypothetical protein
MAAHQPPKLGGQGSSPWGYAKYNAPMAERPNATVCKTVKPQVQILLGAPNNGSANRLATKTDLKSAELETALGVRLPPLPPNVIGDLSWTHQNIGVGYTTTYSKVL